MKDHLEEWGTSIEKDYISAFLITEDRKNILIIGDKYHYVIDNFHSSLTLLLDQDSRNGLSFSNSDIEMTSKGYIRGKIEITAEVAKISPELAASLSAHGYNSSRGNTYLYRSFNIAGRAYSAPQNFVPGSTFNKTYTIEIKRDATSIQNAIKLPLTPVVMTGDMAVFITEFGAIMALGILVCIKDEITGTSYFGGSC